MKKLLVSLTLISTVFAMAPAAVLATTPAAKAKSVATTKKTAVAKKKTTVKKTTKKVVVNKRAPQFTASVAAQSVSVTGNKPPAGYMEALNKALKTYLSEKAAAKGNKAKLAEAEAHYNDAQAAAQALLSQ